MDSTDFIRDLAIVERQKLQSYSEWENFVLHSTPIVYKLLRIVFVRILSPSATNYRRLN